MDFAAGLGCEGWDWLHTSTSSFQIMQWSVLWRSPRVSLFFQRRVWCVRESAQGWSNRSILIIWSEGDVCFRWNASPLFVWTHWYCSCEDRWVGFLWFWSLMIFSVMFHWDLFLWVLTDVINNNNKTSYKY